jgi:hypothetical protein
MPRRVPSLALAAKDWTARAFDRTVEGNIVAFLRDGPSRFCFPALRAVRQSFPGRLADLAWRFGVFCRAMVLAHASPMRRSFTRS